MPGDLISSTWGGLGGQGPCHVPGQKLCYHQLQSEFDVGPSQEGQHGPAASDFVPSVLCSQTAQTGQCLGEAARQAAGPSRCVGGLHKVSLISCQIRPLYSPTWNNVEAVQAGEAVCSFRAPARFARQPLTASLQLWGAELLCAHSQVEQRYAVRDVEEHSERTESKARHNQDS